MTESFDGRLESLTEGWAVPAPLADATEARETATGFTRNDNTSLARMREYQASIERASALLCKVQPDLIAGETIALKETEPPRSSWPIILAICASGLFWLGIGWAITALV